GRKRDGTKEHGPARLFRDAAPFRDGSTSVIRPGPCTLTGMRLLLTNDDGILAPGLQALFETARQLGDPVVVAPVEALSGCSHRVTTDGPLSVERREPARIAPAATPADAARVGRPRRAPDRA